MEELSFRNHSYIELMAKLAHILVEGLELDDEGVSHLANGTDCSLPQKPLVGPVPGRDYILHAQN